MTKPLHLALIGENVQYSLSPQIFEAIFQQSGTAGRFDLRSVSQARLGDAVGRLVSDGVLGLSVTIPHKRRIIEHLDELDATAGLLAAVNSVRLEPGRLMGYNTDSYGVVYALNRAGIQSDTGPVWLYGSGGGARAVIHALYGAFGVRRFVVYGRTEANLADLKLTMSGAMPGLDITTRVETAVMDRPAESPTMVVNCTPLGGANHPRSTPFGAETGRNHVNCYLDLNYNDDNKALRVMRTRARTVVDGSAMLVAQALKSFELWTERKVAFEPIYDAVFGRRT